MLSSGPLCACRLRSLLLLGFSAAPCSFINWCAVLLYFASPPPPPQHPPRSPFTRRGRISTPIHLYSLLLPLNPDSGPPDREEQAHTVSRNNPLLLCCCCCRCRRVVYNQSPYSQVELLPLHAFFSRRLLLTQLLPGNDDTQ